MEKLDERLKEAILTSKKKVKVIVVTNNGSGEREEKLVRKLGGRVLDHLPIIKGFSAEVPITGISKLAEDKNVRKIFLDEEVTIG